MLTGYNSVYAVPATPYPIAVTQPDGSTIQIYLRGDEFFHYKITLDGYLLKTNDEGFLVYAQLDEEGIMPTNVRASNIENRTMNEVELLKTQQPFPDVTIMYQQQRAQRAAMMAQEDTEVMQRFPSTGSPRSLVILVNFSDRSFSVPNPGTAFTNLLNETGYSANGGTGSARDYFISSSAGKFTPQFDVVGPYTLPNTMAFYGATPAGDTSGDVNPRQMIIDACKAADNDVDFTQYATSGVVDNVFVFYAGHNEAEGGGRNTIWPHRWVVPASFTTDRFDGMRIYDYACTSELRGSSGSSMCGIGTFVHEFGHVLGLPDFYATNYASHQTLSSWSVMDSGGYSNQGRTPPSYSAYERFFVGWINPVEIKTPGNMTLDTLTTSNTAYVITQNGDHNLNGKSPNPTEFFMLENRQQKGWDAYLPGHGMLITRINYNPSTWNSNSVNDNAAAMGYEIIRANGSTLAGYPFPGTSGVKEYTPVLRGGTSLTTKALKQIEEVNGKITFSYMDWGAQVSVDESIHLFETVQGTPSATQDLSLNGSRLVGNMNIELGLSTNSHFEIQLEGDTEWKKSLTIVPVAATITNQKILVRYNPSVPSYGNVHTDVIRIATESAENIQINMRGMSTSPIVPPVVKEAENITSHTFTACWDPVVDASRYYITAFEQTTTSDTVFIAEGLLKESTSHTFTGLREKEYVYKVQAGDLYGNITGFSNSMTVRLLDDNASSKVLPVTVNQDGSLKVSRASANDPLYVYNMIGVLVRELNSTTSSIRIDDLPKSQMYILKSGDRLAKIFFK